MAGRKGSTFPLVTPLVTMFTFGLDPDEPVLSLQNVRFAVGAGSGSPLTTKGDIFGFGVTETRIPVGTDNQVLIADSVEALGVKYGLVDNVNIAVHISTKITITAKGQLNSAIVYNDQANIFGDFIQTFKDNSITIESPDGLTPTTLVNSQQTLARNLTIPILTANRNIVVTGEASQIALGTEVTGAITDLSDVTAKTGTGTTVVMSTSPTIVTPTIASFVNANHNHTNAVGGGTLLSTNSLADTANLARNTNNLSFFAATTSAQLASVISNETGTGSLVFDTSPTIVNPIIATPTLINPIITDFMNSIHDHSNAAGGGTLTNNAIAIGAEIDVSKLANGTPGQFIRTDATGTGVEYTDDIFTINFIIDGGGSTITTGIKGQVVVDFNCEVIEWAIIGLPAGAIVVDVSRSTFAGFPTTTTLSATEKPTIVATNDTGENRTLTDWAAINTGDILEFEVDSVTTIQRCTVALKCRKTG